MKIVEIRMVFSGDKIDKSDFLFVSLAMIHKREVNAMADRDAIIIHSTRDFLVTIRVQIMCAEGFLMAFSIAARVGDDENTS
ncbi:hypothetical protein C1O30_09385 [Dickeya zeae]|nr:hypothetical protein C1O30_09385 [Dickeya zeae]